MNKKIYIVLHSSPRYDDVDFAVFSNKDKAMKEFNEWKKYIKENYIAFEEDEDTSDLFRRFDRNYGSSMPFVSIDEIGTTKDMCGIFTDIKE